MTESMTGAQSLVRSLEHAGVDVVFGIPGGAILPLYDPLMDSPKIRHILVRHEQGAGHAAEGFAAATGRVGVCMATSGPGATNLITAIADANRLRAPSRSLAHPAIGTNAAQTMLLTALTAHAGALTAPVSAAIASQRRGRSSSPSRLAGRSGSRA